MNGLTGVVYGYIFSLSLLRKYRGKWSHTWSEIDMFRERWNH